MSDLMHNAAPPEAPAPSPAEPAPREFDLLCEGCGYSLIGIMSDRCPECGKTFDPTELPLARIPWLYRKRLGVIRAYLQTTMMILTRGQAFAAEMCRPVRISAADARSFRKVSIWIAIVSVMFAIAFGIVLTALEKGVNDVKAVVGVSIIYVIVIPALLVFFRLGSDMPTFIWRGLPDAPNTLAPLHHYAAAPLALLAPTAIVAAIILAIDGFKSVPFNFIIVLLVIFIFSMLWCTSLVLMRGGSDCSSSRVTLLAIYLPFHWLLIGFMCFMGTAGAIAVFVG